MRRTHYRYQGYRGRSTANDKLRVVAIILFVLVVLAAAGLFFGQKYIFYTDSGLRLELPFFQQEKLPDTSIFKSDIEVLVEASQHPVQLPSGTESHAKSRLQLVDGMVTTTVGDSLQTDPVEDGVLRAVLLPVEELQTGVLIQHAKELGANAVILDMKTDQGELNFVTEQILGQQCEASSRNVWINAQLQAAAENTYLIARVSCFRDQLLAGSPAYAVGTASGPWTDNGGISWSSAGSLNVRNYLVGVMVELAQLGFDEILLDNWGFPSQEMGDLSSIQGEEIYDPSSLGNTVSAFLQQAKEALAQYDVRLSLVAPDALASLNSNGGGQTLAQLQSISGRVWVREGSAASFRMKLPQTDLVEIVEDFYAEQEGSQAVLDEAGT